MLNIKLHRENVKDVLTWLKLFVEHPTALGILNISFYSYLKPVEISRG